MTNPNLTEIIFIVDRSGSMGTIRNDVIGGYNTFIKNQQKVEGMCRVTFVQFDDAYEVVYDGRPLPEVPYLDENTYVPRGLTALLDAIGRTINTVGQRLQGTPESERPGKVVVVVITDGHENHSREFSRETILKMIKQQQEEYSWEFVYLAANQDAIDVGTRMGIKHNTNFAHTGRGVGQTFSFLDQGITSYRRGMDANCLDIPDVPDSPESFDDTLKSQ